MLSENHHKISRFIESEDLLLNELGVVPRLWITFDTTF